MLNEIKKEFKDYYTKIVKDKRYYVPLLFFCFISYAFSIFNRTVSIDDLSYCMFGYDKHLGFSSFRWGLYLLNIFINTKEYTPFIGRFFALLFQILNAIMLSFIFYIVNDRYKNVWSYSFLSIMFTTYPLINELWYCTGLSVPIQYNGVSFYYLFVLLALILQLFDTRNVIDIKRILLIGAVLTPAMAGYESVIFSYITLVFIILFFKKITIGKDYNWLADGIKFALPLFVSIVFRYMVGYILIWIFDLNAGVGAGGTSINWLHKDFLEVIKQLLNNGWYYLIRGFSYMPIAEFDIAIILFICVVIRRKMERNISIVLCLLLLLSIFSLSILMGDYLHYRMAQSVQLFVSFVAYIIVKETDNTIEFNGIKLQSIVVILLLIVSLKQSIYLHELLALNNQRSDNEAYIAKQIGYRIYSEFDKEKTVIFCGEYQLGSFIENQITVKKDSFAEKIENAIRDITGHHEKRLYQEFVCTNINSFFNTQMDAFNGQIMLKNYFSYYGFDINVLEDLTDDEEDKLKGYYELIAKQNNMKPFDIKDFGDYLLVYLGPTIDGVDKLKYK